MNYFIQKALTRPWLILKVTINIIQHEVFAKQLKDKIETHQIIYIEKGLYIDWTLTWQLTNSRDHKYSTTMW